MRRALFLGMLGVALLATPALGQDDEAEPVESLFGQLSDAGDPVVGVVVVVETADGDEVGAATTDANGRWALDLPGPGRYAATLDVDTLPEGVEPRGDPTRTITVLAGQDRAIIISLGLRAARDTPTTVERIAQTAVNGLRIGLLLALAAVGLSLIFGTTGLINFAHGELVSFGAIAAFFLSVEGPGWHLIPAAIVAALLTGALGGVLELGMFRPLRRRQLGPFQLLVITIGLSLLARNALLVWFGGQPLKYRDYAIQTQWDLGPVSIAPRDVAVMAISALLLVAVATALQRTRMGTAVRAVSDNESLAAASGIDVERVVVVVWVVGALLAGVGGIFIGSVETVSHLMGFRQLLLLFAAIILGGLGTAYGAMVGGIVIGVVTEVSTVWVAGELKVAMALAVLVVVLLSRPQGILGVSERVG